MRQFDKIKQLIEEGISRYNILEKEDRILAAISGGKDSLTMLYALSILQKKAAFPFEVVAINIKTDFHCGSCMHSQILVDIFESLGLKYYFKEIKVLDEKKTTSCFWCSWNRRKCLFETAEDLGCNKVALGHHKDDIVETILLNLFYKGEVAAMKPSQELFGGKIKLIRPLCLVEEQRIIEFANENNFPKQLCRCPFGAASKRKEMKTIIKEFSEAFPEIDIRQNIFNSVSDGNLLSGTVESDLGCLVGGKR
ncbi:MAG: hypothetical protein HQL27_03215 [Candidatus Omnitrophica bacterium]|nr:hypothetical protein [Candidatus Omnitrophota bacterium]